MDGETVSSTRIRRVLAEGDIPTVNRLLGTGYTLSGKVELAAIHDGARPLVTWQVIDRAVRAANTYGAAAPAVPVKDTIKVVRGGVVAATPDRSTLQAVQTPQLQLIS